MDFKFRNKQVTLNKLDNAKIKEIVVNAVRERENMFKKHLNDEHINTIIQN